MSGLDTKSAMLPDVHKVNRSCGTCLSANEKHVYSVKRTIAKEDL